MNGYNSNPGYDIINKKNQKERKGTQNDLSTLTVSGTFYRRRPRANYRQRKRFRGTGVVVCPRQLKISHPSSEVLNTTFERCI